MKNSVKLGDTIYVPVKIDRIITTKECGEEVVTYYGGMLKCFRPGVGERQRILVCFDNDYILEKCQKEEEEDV